MDSSFPAALSSSDKGKMTLPLHESFPGSSPQNPPQRASSSSPQSLRRFNLHESSSDEQLPTWSNSSNPQSPGDGDALGRTNSNGFSAHHNGSSSHGGLMKQQWTLLVLLILIAAGSYVSINSRNRLQQSLDEVVELLENSDQLKSKLTDAEKGIRRLQREVSAHDAMQQHHSAQQQEQQHGEGLPKGGGGNPYANQAMEEMNKMSEQLEATTQKAKQLKQRVQFLSRQEALQKYGNGIYRVEIELAFPDQAMNPTGPTKFVIELAPLDLMPHSVHFFLEMVSTGLLDGCSFILNALHVLKAAPLPYDGSSAASKARAFQRMGLESVAFKEYSDRFPHAQYTVGFAADGSPSFYINTEDNQEIHMGDPCFGKIVEGFDTVKRLESSPTRNGIWFEQRIGIKKATVLNGVADERGRNRDEATE